MSDQSVSREERWLGRAARVPALPLLLAWTFGLWRLAAQTLWIDEWFTVHIVATPWPQVLSTIVATERRPPLYWLSLKLWAALASDQELALRLYSLAMVLLSVALVYALGRRLLNRATALLAATLLALSPFWLLYGRMMRAYSQTMMLALLSTWLLTQAIYRRRAWWAAYALAGLALLYTDYSGLAVLAAHGAYVLAKWFLGQRRSLKYWSLSTGVMLLGFLPWVPNILVHTGRGVRITDLASGLRGFVLKLLVPFYSWSAGETLYPWHPAGALGALTVGLLLLWGLIALARRQRTTFWLVIAGIGAPLIFTASLLTLIATDITFLNAASRSPAGAPFFYFGVAAGMAALPRRWLRWAAGAVLLATVAVSSANYFAGQQFLNPIYAVPLHQVTADIAAQAGPHDLIVGEFDTLFGYYHQPAPDAATYQDVDAEANLAWIAAHQPPSVWLLIFGRDSTADAFTTPQLLAWLNEHYRAGATWGYAPVAPRYQQVKQMLTGRPAYGYKLQVQQFVRP